MPDLFYLWTKWWKQISAVVLFALIIAFTITLMLPKKFLSVATALPANSYLADKSKIFNDNIQALYSSMGTADELDMIIGTGQLDTIYFFAVDSFRLTEHYPMSEKGDAAKNKAAVLLKKNTRIMKSEYGELKVRVWDTDKKLAANLANVMIDKIQSIHSDLQNSNNLNTLNSLIIAKQKLISTSDTLASATTLQKYEKMIGEYQLMVDARPSALLMVERARPSVIPDTPKLLPVLLVTVVFSLLFAFLLALMLEKKKSSSL